MAEVSRWKDMVGGQERQRLHRESSNRDWLNAILHRINGMELYWEELQDNFFLRYGLKPQYISVINHALSFHVGGLVLVWND